MNAQHLVVSAGRVVYGPYGAPPRDAGPALTAISRLLRISQRRARLLRLDALARPRGRVLDDSAVDQAIAELESELLLGGVRPSTR